MAPASFRLNRRSKASSCGPTSRRCSSSPPSPGFLRGQRYELTVRGTMAGLEEDHRHEFTVGGRLEVAYVIPADGDTEVPTAGQILVQFNRSVAALTVLQEGPAPAVLEFRPAPGRPRRVAQHRPLSLHPERPAAEHGVPRPHPGRAVLGGRRRAQGGLRLELLDHPPGRHGHLAGPELHLGGARCRGDDHVQPGDGAGLRGGSGGAARGGGRGCRGLPSSGAKAGTGCPSVRWNRLT